MMEGQNRKNGSEKTDLNTLKRMAITRYLMLFPVLGLLMFLPAWTLRYWEGWVYIFILAIPMAVFGQYLFTKDPELLERRMRTRENRKEQKLVIKLSLLVFPLIYILPGFDKRLVWSEVPLFIQVVSFILVLIGYLMVLNVFKANSYASRVVEVDAGQKVISTGPYAIVRHPMYSAVIVLYFFTPLALGSYWAVIPATLFLLVFIPRILDEEKELVDNLEGYREYRQKVKYRLIPGVW